MSGCDNCGCDRSLIAGDIVDGAFCAVCWDAHHDAGAALDLTEVEP